MPVMEIAIEPVGTGDIHLREFVTRIVRIVHESGLPYRVGPMATVVQGSVPALLDLARRMHEAARHGEDAAPRVLTTIRIDDTIGTEHNLDDRVRVIEETLWT